jgi:predicted kinase
MALLGDDYRANATERQSADRAGLLALASSTNLAIYAITFEASFLRLSVSQWGD